METANKDIDYNILGYHKQEVFDIKGDLTTVNYHKNYDGVTYSDLKVKEERTYTRDVATGLLIERDTVITWYLDGNEAGTKNTKKYYTAQKGFVNNKRARQNLIDKASMYLFSQIGKTDARIFWGLMKGFVDDYVATGDLALVTEINNSTEIYMTGIIKSTLESILNVVY